MSPEERKSWQMIISHSVCTLLLVGSYSQATAITKDLILPNAALRTLMILELEGEDQEETAQLLFASFAMHVA
jgi:hypothetical protein